MTKAWGAAAVPAVLLACVPAAPPATTSNGATAGLCRTGERALWQCPVGGKPASVCLGANSIHYRSASGAGEPLDIASDASWSNIHIGGNRSQGGLNQDHIRFSSQGTHYVVHAGETGSLNERPGLRVSGVAVLRGAAAEEMVESLDCRAGTPFVTGAFQAISGAAPQEWDGEETDDDPFDAIY